MLVVSFVDNDVALAKIAMLLFVCAIRSFSQQFITWLNNNCIHSTVASPSSRSCAQQLRAVTKAYCPRPVPCNFPPCS